MSAFDWGLILAGAGLAVAGAWVTAQARRATGGEPGGSLAGGAHPRRNGTACLAAGAVLIGMALL